MNQTELRSKYYDFLEDTWDNLDDSEKLASINQLYDLFDDSYITDEYGENVMDIYDFYYIVWNNQSPEIKTAASRELLNRVKSHILSGDIKLRNDDRTIKHGLQFEETGSGLSKIFNSQPEEVKKELFECLKQIMPADNYPFKQHRNYFNDMMRRIWMDASAETQLENQEILDYILQLSIDDYETKLLNVEKNKKILPDEATYQEHYDRAVQEGTKQKNNSILELIRNTKPKLPKHQLQFLIEQNPQMQDSSKYNIDDLYSLYEQIFEYNNSINSTLSLETLAALGKKIDIMKLIRISSTSVDLQDNLISLINQSTATKSVIIDSINSEYWDTELSAISENFHTFRDFFKNIDTGNIDLSTENIDNLKNIMLQPNYFRIENLDDLKNYDDIKNDICKKILSGNELDPKYKAINQMDKDEKQKFAILEMQYGISLDMAINIVEKYGSDIDEINDPEYAEIIAQIKNIKSIVTSKNILQLYEDHKNDMNNFFGKSSISISELEGESLNLYAKLYQKDFDEHSITKNIESISEVKYDDSTIKIAKVSPYQLIDGKKKRSEISAFARVEGAYANWQEPEDFKASLDIANITYHGNCKSTIRSNSLSIARPNGPTFAYNNCPKNTLKLMAPWDIVSATGNTSFAINSLKWNEAIGFLDNSKISGIQFRTPQKNTDYTRHGHNEAVSERLVVDGKKFTKDEPDYILFMLEAGEKVEDYEELLSKENFGDLLKTAQDKRDFAEEKKSETLTDEDYKVLNAERWRISKKAAKQLNKDIYLIDRDEFRECEEIRFNQLLDAFNNPTKKIDFIEDKDSTLSQAELLEKIVVEFENNTTSNEFARNKGIFNGKNRQKIFDTLNKKINSYKKSNPALYEELSQKLDETYTTEYEKSYSNLGKEVSSPDFKKFYLQKHLELGNKREYETGNSIRTLESDEQGIQYSAKTRNMIERINKTDFYEGNRNHSIEHIDKVVLFAGVLAKNEELDERTTDLLLIASAFHDCGRKIEKDKNSRAGHAWEGTLVLHNYLKAHPENEFGITKENEPILEVAIQYHEYKENKIGKTDLAELKRLCDDAGVKPEDFETAVKVSELLRDADALDRERFSRKGKLDIRHLKSTTAKKASMISYAQEVNKAYAKEILSQNYDVSEEELRDASPVDIIFNKRTHSRSQTPEEHLPLSKRLELMESAKAYTPEAEEKNNMLMKLYDMFGVDKQSMGQAKGFIKRTLDKIKTSFIERS